MLNESVQTIFEFYGELQCVDTLRVHFSKLG